MFARTLMIVQLLLGVGKVWFAFSKAGTQRRQWHFWSGVVIAGLALFNLWLIGVEQAGSGDGYGQSV